MLEFLKAFQLDFMLFLAGGCGILAILALFTQMRTRRRKHAMVWLEIVAMTLLLADRLAYAYRGDTSVCGFYMVRISNFLVYFLSMYTLHIFNLYLMDLILVSTNRKRSPESLIFCEFLFTLGEVLIVANLFTNFYYYFDATNHYVRKPGFLLSLSIGFLISLLQIINILKYRKKLGRGTVVFLLAFSLIPYVGTIIQIFCYGLSITNITLVGMCVLLYVFEIINMNRMQKAMIMAEKASNAKSRFLANMSHEIRTPINTILGMDEMILREDASGVPKHYFMSVINYALDIRFASESLLSLINDILDLSKIESGKMHLVEQEYEMLPMLQGIVTMIRIKGNEKSLYFELDIDENLPKKLYGDEKKIKQIVLNLLTNAVKYTEKGGFTLTVKVTEKVGNIYGIMLSVRDTGIGVKTDDIPKLFTAFERLDEDRNSGVQGTGLGLNISYQFAKLLGGDLTCSSVYGEGSEFIFTLPQTVIDPEPMGPFKEHDEPKSLGPYVPKFTAPDARIMVVDDNELNLAVIKGLLKSTKATIDAVTSGQECIRYMEKNKYDIVLLDHMMPGLDGIHTLDKIREMGLRMPIVALTANIMQGGYDFYRSKGFDGYITKPIDSTYMEELLLKLLPPELVHRNNPMPYNTQKDFPDELKWIRDVKELDIEAGIKANGGIDLYIASICLFYDTIDDLAAAIKDALVKGDYELFTVKVHSLKSSAGIVGATRLAELAADLEAAGKNKDIDFIDTYNQDFLDEYLAYKDRLARLKEMIARYTTVPTEMAKEKALTDADRDEAVKALRDMSEQMDYDGAMVVIDGLKEYRLTEADRDVINRMESAVRKYDWDALDRILEECE